MDENIIARCMAISMSHFLNTPYKEKNVMELYAANGIANKASGICHYCTIDTLKTILSKGSLRFSDIRFLNDTTEFVEIIPLIKKVLSRNEYASDFRLFLLESNEMKELKEYTQSYIIFSKDENKFVPKTYRTYTCSFSTEKDSLSMWNYYATSGEGVNIVFDHAWNMFEGSEKTELNNGERIEKDIIIFRGLIIYKESDKEKCIMELLDHLQAVYDDAKDDIEKYRNHILFAFKESINHMRCFFKNEAFESENEYRVVLKIPEDLLHSTDSDSEIVEKDQFKRGNILIPYIDYRFKKESIERVTLNPYIMENDNIFKLGIKELLWYYQMKDVEIVPSCIPIRKYT